MPKSLLAISRSIAGHTETVELANQPEMAKQEIGRVGGFVAYASVIAILIILLAVCALVVVNALKQSPWGAFTIAMTIPIAFLMGIYLRRLRPGRVLETSALGFVLVMSAIWGVIRELSAMR